MKRTRRILAATVIAAALSIGVSACSLFADTSVPVATAAAPTGVDGAVNFDDRFIAAGTGQKKVDIWFDAMLSLIHISEPTRLNGESRVRCCGC